MAQYKALVGTIVYKTESADGYFMVELSAESEGCELPEIVLGVEMVLLVNLIRKATKKIPAMRNSSVSKPKRERRTHSYSQSGTHMFHL